MGSTRPSHHVEVITLQEGVVINPAVFNSHPRDTLHEGNIASQSPYLRNVHVYIENKSMGIRAHHDELSDITFLYQRTFCAATTRRYKCNDDGNLGLVILELSELFCCEEFYHL
jgi:hypothetical protein